MVVAREYQECSIPIAASVEAPVFLGEHVGNEIRLLHIIFDV